MQSNPSRTRGLSHLSLPAAVLWVATAASVAGCTSGESDRSDGSSRATAGTGGTPADCAAPPCGGGGAAGVGPDAGSSLEYPPVDRVVDAMVLANQWFMHRHPDPGDPAPGNRPSNLWTRAVYYEGLLALYALVPEASYYEYAVEWGNDNDWSLRDLFEPDHADPQCAGQTYIDLYQLDDGNHPEWIRDITASIDAMVTSPVVDSWTWIDALQMSMPVFVRLGVLDHDTAYFEKMWQLYSYTRDTEGGGLFNSESGLWWRDADFSPGGTYLTTPNGEDIHWSRGNGWVMAALARTLDWLPASDPHRVTYEDDLRAMAEALMQVQRDDGFWNTSLVDPTHCADQDRSDEDGPETSGTALFTYGIAWGIRSGLLDESRFGPLVIDAWNGLAGTALHPDGMLGYIQSTGVQPCDPEGSGDLGYDVVPNHDDFGVGCFLLAGSEIARLAQP